jgi:GT2 family glycosyltransferase
MKKNSVLPMFICPGEMPMYFAKSLEMQYRANNNVLPFQGTVDARLNNARTHNGEMFLASEAEWALLVDTDMVWDPQALPRLLRTAKELKVKAVSGLAFMKRTVQGQTRIIPPAYVNTEQGLMPFAVLPSLEKPFQVSAVGGACFLVHRDVYQALSDNCPTHTNYPWQDEEIALDGGMRGEDLTFCNRITNNGFEIWYEPRAVFGHVKTHIVGVPEYLEFVEGLQD